MKRNLALLLMLALCLTIFAGMPTSAFSDVSADHRHTTAITYLTEKGVINGYEDGSFKPENTITRAEFVKMLLEFLGFGNVYGDSIINTGFTDVDAKTMTVTSKNEDGKEETKTTQTGQHWAAGYIKLAVDKKVVNGYGDGRFGPDDPVKYEEAIKMIVCCLGREEYAKTRANLIGKELWPDGYLSIGNDLMVAKTTDYALGENASRSNVAQMLHNVKDVQVIIPPTVSIGGVTTGGGGISMGGGGSSDGDVTSSTEIVTGLITHGQVVAAVKRVGDSAKPLIIDENIVINGQAVTSVTNNYIIVKLEVPIEGESYAQFYTNGSDFSNYLGQRTKIKYRFNPDGGRSGRYEIETITAEETEFITITSDAIKRTDTINKNLGSSQYYLCYTDGDRDYDEPLFTDDLDTLTVIYNNKVVDVDSLGNDPMVKSDIITLSDLMPEMGRVTLVNADEDASIDVVWIESYETYVVGARNFNASPKSITDKFRTTNGTTPLTLTLDDTDPNVDLYIRQDGSEKEVTDIALNSILKVAKSKCGKNIDITIERAATATGVYKTRKTDNSGRNIFELTNGRSYPVNKYFTDYVDSTLEYEMGDTLTLYLNKAGEIVWATVAEVTYTTGYLIRAIPPEPGTGKIILEIITSSGTKKTYTMADTNTRYITKATTSLSSVTPNSMTNPNGYLYKNLSDDLIYQSLLENANLINYGEDGVDAEGSTNYSDAEEKARKKDKPSSILSNATTAQPIMYTTASENTLSHLVTFEPDTRNRFTGTSLQYRKLGSGEYNFSNLAGSFSAASTATFIFVPNNRTAAASDIAKAYKIGKASSTAISSKLVEYMNYNIEPFYTTNSSGTKVKTAFVVYNQAIDEIPTYRSDNIIVSSIEETPTDGSTKYTLKGYVASNSSTKQYVTYSPGVLNGYVLNESFARTGERRSVEVGDVVRIGYTVTGNIASIDIILDATDTYKAQAGKVTAMGKDSTTLNVNDPSKFLVYYYARMGEITAIDSSEVPEWCEIKISNSLTSRVTIGTGFSTKQILMYDHTATDDPGTEKDDRLKTVTMSDLWGGEVLYVWQGENLTYKQIYAVRYPVAQP